MSKLNLKKLEKIKLIMHLTQKIQFFLLKYELKFKSKKIVKVKKIALFAHCFEYYIIL